MFNQIDVISALQITSFFVGILLVLRGIWEIGFSKGISKQA